MNIPNRSFCPDSLLDWRQDEFITENLQIAPTVEWVHGQSPRFGQGKDLLQFIEGDNDYFWGLVTSTILLAVLYSLWALWILYQSGGPLQLLPPPRPPIYPIQEDEGEQLLPVYKDPTVDPALTKTQVKTYVRDYRHYKRRNDQWQRESQTTQRRLCAMRLSILVSSLVILLTCILFSFAAMDLISTVHTAQDTVGTATEWTWQGSQYVEVYQQQRQIAMSRQETFRNQVNSEYCPKLKATICNNDDICDYEGLPYAIPLQTTMESLFGGTPLNDFQEDLQLSIQELDQWQDNLDDFEWALYTAVAINLTLAIVSVYFFFAVLMAYQQRKILGDHIHGIVLKLFLLLVLLAWIFSSVFILGSITVADLCIDTPNDKFLGLLHASPILSSLIHSILQQCSPALQMQEFTEEMTVIWNSMQHVVALEDILFRDNILLDLEAVCDTQLSLADTAAAVADDSCQVISDLGNVREHFQCNTWHPLYATAVESICYHASENLVWMSMTQSILVFVSMLVVTLRAALYPIQWQAAWEQETRLAPTDTDVQSSLLSDDIAAPMPPQEETLLDTDADPKVQTSLLEAPLLSPQEDLLDLYEPSTQVPTDELASDKDSDAESLSNVERVEIEASQELVGNVAEPIDVETTTGQDHPMDQPTVETLESPEDGTGNEEQDTEPTDAEPRPTDNNDVVSRNISQGEPVEMNLDESTSEDGAVEIDSSRPTKGPNASEELVEIPSSQGELIQETNPLKNPSEEQREPRHSRLLDPDSSVDPPSPPRLSLLADLESDDDTEIYAASDSSASRDTPVFHNRCFESDSNPGPPLEEHEQISASHDEEFEDAEDFEIIPDSNTEDVVSAHENDDESTDEEVDTTLNVSLSTDEGLPVLVSPQQYLEPPELEEPDILPVFDRPGQTEGRTEDDGIPAELEPSTEILQVFTRPADAHLDSQEATVSEDSGSTSSASASTEKDLSSHDGASFVNPLMDSDTELMQEEEGHFSISIDLDGYEQTVLQGGEESSLEDSTAEDMPSSEEVIEIPEKPVSTDPTEMRDSEEMLEPVHRVVVTNLSSLELEEGVKRNDEDLGVGNDTEEIGSMELDAAVNISSGSSSSLESSLDPSPSE